MNELREVLIRAGLDVASLAPLDTPREESDDEQEASPSSSNYRLTISSSQAVRMWLRLRDLVAETGYWPVLLGYGAEVVDYRRGRERPPVFSGIDPAEWFQGCREDRLASLEEQLEELYDIDEVEEARRLEQQVEQGGYPRSPWPEGEVGDLDSPELFSKHFRTPNQPLHIGLIPTGTPWEIPRILNFGGWNECPNPEEHASVLKYWMEKYDAELMTLTKDVLELRVGRPPMEPEAAVGLAKEQFLYCPDIVEQGTETIDRLAAGILGSPVWFFWWD